MPLELPGAAPFPTELAESLWRAFRDKGESYQPRTQHFTSAGVPRYINRLIFETSPYLLQHAHNPVDWRPWGPSAQQEAERRGQPILLSVGYSTCHWCHVMEQESFEDEEIAAFINGNFVPVKVDREERPDVDRVYMSVVQLMTGGGGWPMTVVTLPDGRPFFGGTYFPPRDGDRGARIGFLSILQRLVLAHSEESEQVTKAASQLSRALAQASRPAPRPELPTEEALDRAAEWLSRRFDPEYGGFGRAPKFPRPATYELLLRHHHRSQDADSLHMVTRSLHALADGGIHDHVGGGFARYSTDDRWLVPHFEKMLYDNAQLVSLYLEAFQATKEPRFAEVAAQTSSYLLKDMQDEQGGFFSATDADSEGEEGRFFTWPYQELKELLEPEQLTLLEAGFGVCRSGHFQGRNILHRTASWEDLSARLKTGEPELTLLWQQTQARLAAARAQRVRPLLDDKIIAEWNGQAVASLAKAGFVLDRPDLTEAAVRAADFLWNCMRDERGRLHRTFRAGTPRHEGILEDHAFVAAGYLELFETTGEPLWLERAQALMEILEDHFWDTEHGGYFGTAVDAEPLLVREKPAYDGAQPSGNAVAALNHLRLERWTGHHPHREKAEGCLGLCAADLGAGAMESPKMAVALDLYSAEPLEILVVAGPDDPRDLLHVLRRTFLPHAVRVVTDDPEALGDHLEWAKGRPRGPRSAVHICRNRTCSAPITSPEVLKSELSLAHQG